jgi:hypothetical protein
VTAQTRPPAHVSGWCNSCWWRPPAAGWATCAPCFFRPVVWVSKPDVPADTAVEHNTDEENDHA